MRAGSHLHGCDDCWSRAMAVRGALDALVEEAGGACRIRPSHYGAGKFDAVLGDVRAADEIARIIGFDSDPVT